MRSTPYFGCSALAATLLVGLVARDTPAAEQDLARYAPDNRPFTAAWHLDHPRNWRVTPPPADAWKPATLAEATAWLGMDAAAKTPIYSDAYEATAPAPSDSRQVETAGDLVFAGDLEPNADAGEWLPLGVYALAPRDHARAGRLMRLEINRAGKLRGAFYDALSDSEQAVFGSLDKTTGRVAWTAGSGDGAIFETMLDRLTTTQCPLLLHLPNGQTEVWRLARQPATPE
jgi:hypothetical protein